MYESASERWSPVQSVEKVILSVISMLAGTYYASSPHCHFFFSPVQNCELTRICSFFLPAMASYRPCLPSFSRYPIGLGPFNRATRNGTERTRTHVPARTTRTLEPNLESGANIDCCKLYRDNKAVRSLSLSPLVLATCSPVPRGFHYITQVTRNMAGTLLLN